MANPHSGWTYYREVTLSGATPSNNYDVLVTLEATFSYAHCKTNGEDLRFYDASDNVCKYFIEEWYSSGKTYVWVQVPNSGTTKIYMEYGNAGASSGAEAYSGRAYIHGDEDTFSGYDEATELGAKYVKGKSTSGGTGGSETHTHGAGTLAYGGASAGGHIATNTNTGTDDYVTTDSDHSHNPAVADPVETKNHEPPYYKMTVFKYAAGKVPRLLTEHLHCFFDAAPASGTWTRFADADDKFIKNCTVLSGERGGTGGGTTHYHSVYSNTYTQTGDRTGSGGLSMPTSHNHTTYTPDLAVEFPYLKMLWYASGSTSNAIINKVILMFSALPPLGWDRFTALDDKYVVSASSYGGSSSGSNLTHNHTPNTPSSNNTGTTSRPRVGSTAGWYYKGTHNHDVSGTLDNATIDIPYYEMIFGKRKDPAVTTSYGSEQTGGGVIYTLSTMVHRALAAIGAC